jgi:hypothetical protein
VARISGLTRGAGLALMVAGLVWACAAILWASDARLPAAVRDRLDRAAGGSSPALRYLLESD